MKHSLFSKGLCDIKFLLSVSFIVGLGIFKVDAQTPASFAYEVTKQGLIKQLVLFLMPKTISMSGKRQEGFGDLLQIKKGLVLRL